jgi:hypothetical protein
VRYVLLLLMMCSVALAVGFGLSWAALTDGRLFGATQVGPWVAWSNVGSSAPNPYTRAHLARAATLPLGQAEGLQFTAVTDSAGEPLTRNCSYRISGRTPVATFWTLAAVDEVGVNIAAENSPPTMRSSRLARTGDGAINITIGTELMPLNWLELSGEGEFRLVLTLYDIAVFSGFSGPGDMPVITAEGCR